MNEEKPKHEQHHFPERDSIKPSFMNLPFKMTNGLKPDYGHTNFEALMELKTLLE
jgi:hypothetical protein